MLIHPSRFLFLLVAFLAIAKIVFALKQKKHRIALHRLARDWHMHYSAADRFDLAGKIAAGFPVPGAAEIDVTDLIYGSAGESYRYLFCAEYTTGVLRTKHRHRRVGLMTQRKDADEANSSTAWSQLNLAEADDDLIKQYEQLYQGTIGNSKRRTESTTQAGLAT